MSKITHEEAREYLLLTVNNDLVNYSYELNNYINQQKTKDELIKLYKYKIGLLEAHLFDPYVNTKIEKLERELND